VIAIGLVKAVLSGWHPTPDVAPPAPHAAVHAAGLLLLLRAFANGSTALTGVEAISNGVPAFREPSVPRARRSLGLVVGALAILLIGETALCNAFGVVATEPGRAGFQSVLSSLTGAIVGRGIFYHATIASVVAVLLLSANTSFADFPRLCHILAGDRYLPEPFVHRGRRLAFSNGVLVLAALAAILLVVFHGITDRLIPLFAIGALSAFTMSQLGMVGHWRKSRERLARHKLVINAIGAAATGATLVVVLVAKLAEGAWITVVLVAGIVALLRAVHRHYEAIAAATRPGLALELGPIEPPIAVVPLRRWDALALKALRLALRLGQEVVVAQVVTEDRELEDLRPRWDELARGPAIAQGLAPPRLEIVSSSYRELEAPLVALVQRLAGEHPHREIAVVIPELVEPRWYHYLLHNQTPTRLRHALLRDGGPQVIVVSTPWHLAAAPAERRLLTARADTRSPRARRTKARRGRAPRARPPTRRAAPGSATPRPGAPWPTRALRAARGRG
jgi:hypothetical protein